MKNIIIIFIVTIQYGSANNNYYYKNNNKIDITPNNPILRNNTNIDYYQNYKEIDLGVTDKLIVKLKDENSLEKYLHEFNLTLEKTLSKNLYLLKTANRLNEKEEIEYSHPDFIKKMSR